MIRIGRKPLRSVAAEMSNDVPPPPYQSLEEKKISIKVDQKPDRKSLENKILTLWKTVWLGLYRRNEKYGPYHADRLRLLYRGAGMANLMPSGYDGDTDDNSPLGFRQVGLGLLGKVLSKDHFLPSSETYKGIAIAYLCLYEGLSLETLQSVIDVLESYKREIEPLGAVYAFLRNRQIGLRQPTQEDQKAVLEGYPRLADPIAKRLMNYDARIWVLLTDIHDEARAIYGSAWVSKAWRVASRVTF